MTSESLSLKVAAPRCPPNVLKRSSDSGKGQGLFWAFFFLGLFFWTRHSRRRDLHPLKNAQTDRPRVFERLKDERHPGPPSPPSTVGF